jgi:hypothetical protein
MFMLYVAWTRVLFDECLIVGATDADEAVQSMLARWRAVPGTHPLCNASILRSEAAFAASVPVRPRPEGRPSAAAVSILAQLPSDALHLSSTIPPFVLQDFRAHAHSFDRYLLRPFRMDFVVLYQDGAGMDAAIIDIFTALRWQRVNDTGRPTQTGAAGALQHPAHGPGGRRTAVTASGDYITPHGPRVLLRARPFNLPRYLQNDPSLLTRPDWGICANRTWTLSYRLYAGAAFASHVLVDPVLAPYDITFKLDADLLFVRRPSVDPVAAMAAKGCDWAHSKIYFPRTNGPFRDSECHAGSRNALMEYSRTAGTPEPASARHAWCHAPAIFYGNFVGYTSAYLRSPRNAVLATWLYECQDSYFRLRWGDQTPMSMFLCQAHDIVDVHNSRAICDFSSWRGKGRPPALTPFMADSDHHTSPVFYHRHERTKPPSA